MDKHFPFLGLVVFAIVRAQTYLSGDIRKKQNGRRRAGRKATAITVRLAARSSDSGVSVGN